MINRTYMDPYSEKPSQHSAHVRTWKHWWCIEGRHFDNGRRHADHQLQNPPANAQCHFLNVPIAEAPKSRLQRLFAKLTA
jgi:hypothetical protein